MNSRRQRLAAYVWLLEHADPDALIEHLDGVLLIDAWPDIADSLHAAVRKAWEALIEAAQDQWFLDHIRVGFVVSRPCKPDRRALKRTITRLADLGLSRDQIEDLLRRRGR